MVKLKELRHEYGMTRAELSRALSIGQGTLANYENGIREADYRTLALVAQFFDVTIDYLIGQDTFTAPKNQNEFKPLNIQEKSLLKTYRSLSAKSQSFIFDHILYLSDLENNG